MVGTDPTLSLNRHGSPRLLFIHTIIAERLKCAEQIIEAVVSAKSDRVLFTKRTHARRVETSLGNVNQNTSGFLTLLRVQPPTTHDTGISRYQH